MAKDTTTPAPVEYHISAPEQKHWDQTQGLWIPVPPYTSKQPIFGVNIISGKGVTTKQNIAVEFADMGYDVTPNPKIEIVAQAE